MYRPTSTEMSMSCGISASRVARKSGTPPRSTVEWNGTSMPGTMMKAFLPPETSSSACTALSSASQPATVPARAYCEPARL